nr:histidine kinase [Pleionea sp. CnH1-48]
MFYTLYFHIKKPLEKLTYSAHKISAGYLAHKVSIEGEGELSLLADTINRMSDAVSTMYDILEKKVEAKTFELERNQESLQFLYETAKGISENPLMELDFDLWFDKLARIIELPNIQLSIINTRDASEADLAAKETPKDAQELRFALIKDGTNFGILSCIIQPQRKIKDWQYQLLHSFAEQVALALNLKTQRDQDRRMALMTERTTIARELHDSLAQALSYLKIQVTRLEYSIASTEHVADVDDILLELRQGIHSAYRQLRELLTTFRLQISGSGLESALKETVTQFSERYPNIHINLDYEVPSVSFTPNEEIHLLQIAREATQNAIHHSHGTQIDISMKKDTHNQITLSVVDNGIGISDTPEKMEHYGLAIMKERSRNLSGELDIQRLATGTQVLFNFKQGTPPKFQTFSSDNS